MTADVAALTRDSARIHAILEPGNHKIWPEERDLILRVADTVVDLAAALSSSEAALLKAEQALREIADVHSKSVRDEEIETWHEPLFGEDCPDGECDGHVETIKVCGECGTHTHPEFDVWYRRWPCPTFAAARAVVEGETNAT